MSEMRTILKVVAAITMTTLASCAHDPPISQDVYEALVLCSRPFGEEVGGQLSIIWNEQLADEQGDDISLHGAILRFRRSFFADDDLKDMMIAMNISPDELWNDVYHCQADTLKLLRRTLEPGGPSERSGIVIGDIREFAGWFVRYDKRKIAASYTASAVQVSLNLFNNNTTEAILSDIYLTVEEEITPPAGTPFISTMALLDLPVTKAFAEIGEEERVPVRIERSRGDLYAKLVQKGSGQLWIDLVSTRPGVFAMSVTVVFDVGGVLIETREIGIDVAFADAIQEPGQPTKPAPPFAHGRMN